jgi:hypothetical protein
VRDKNEVLDTLLHLAALVAAFLSGAAMASIFFMLYISEVR